MQCGILQLAAGRKRSSLTRWFDEGVKRLPVIEFDASSASRWAQLLATLKRRGRAMPIKDSLIAASALQHGLTVATHNTADFVAAGVPIVDPFS